MLNKPKIAFYCASSCGGCEVSLVNLHEKILDVDANFDLVFCPCLVDTKKKDVEAMADKSLAITFFNGGIRNDDNVEMARLLRKKSQVLVSYGACATGGGIPALANLFPRQRLFNTVYHGNPSIDNPGEVEPQTSSVVSAGTLTLPQFHDKVQTLAQIVDVDFFFPGCPPESAQLAKVVDLLVAGGPLPPKGSFLGSGRKSVCEECRKKKVTKRSQSSAGTGNQSRTPKPVSWSRVSSAWAPPPAMAAEGFVPRPSCPASYVTALPREFSTKEPKWQRPSVECSTFRL